MCAYICTCISVSRCACVLSRSPVQLCAIPMDCSSSDSSVPGTSQKGYWSRLPFPTPRDLPEAGIKYSTLESAALTGRFFTTEPLGKPLYQGTGYITGRQANCNLLHLHPKNQYGEQSPHQNLNLERNFQIKVLTLSHNSCTFNFVVSIFSSEKWSGWS